jgi:hypothetical protein
VSVIVTREGLSILVLLEARACDVIFFCIVEPLDSFGTKDGLVNEDVFSRLEVVVVAVGAVLSN